MADPLGQWSTYLLAQDKTKFISIPFYFLSL